MNDTLLLQEIERLRQRMYRLSHSNHLASQEVIDCSQELDQLLNMYHKRHHALQIKNKQQG